MPICNRCAGRYVSSPVSGLCRQCISIPNPPEIPIVKDEEWNLAEAKANQRLCAILGRVPKLARYKNADPKEFGGYYGINQGQHQISSSSEVLDRANSRGAKESRDSRFTRCAREAQRFPSASGSTRETEERTAMKTLPKKDSVTLLFLFRYFLRSLGEQETPS
jgi:hypothetical protein